MSIATATETTLSDIYPGQEPYGAGQASHYRGRARQVEDMLSILQSSRFLGVVGPEGSGKTSLVMAGLIPTLKDGFKGLAGNEWQACYCRPGITPIENLAFALASIDPQSTDARTSLERQLDYTTLCRSDHSGLIRSVSQLGMQDDQNLLIFIDGFEDLFELSEKYLYDMNSEQEQNLFVSNIARLLSTPGLPVYVAISLRSDHIPSLYNFRSLHPFLGVGLYSIPMFRNDDIDDIVLHGLSLMGIAPETEVMEQLRAEFGQDLRNLPPLQAWLTRAAERYKAPDGSGLPFSLRMQEASLLGALDQQMPDQAETFYANLSDRERQLMCQLFSHISLPGDGQVTKKPQTIREICERRDIPKQELNGLIRRMEMEAPCLLTVTEPYSKQVVHFQEHTYPDSAVVNLDNPYLLRGWKRMSEWLEAEREAVSLYLRLSEASRMYALGQTALLRPPDLDIFQHWWDEFRPQPSWAEQFNTNHRQAHEYLTESVAHHRSETERLEKERKEELRKARKRFIIGLTVGAVSLMLLVVAVYFMRQARESEKEAKSEQEKAEKSMKFARSEAEKASRAERKAADEAKNALIQEKKALKEKKAADSAKFAAEDSRRQAEDAKTSAIANEKKANDLAIEAEDQRKQAVASADQAKKAQAEASKRADYQSAAKRVLDLLLKARTTNFENKDSILHFLHDVSSAYVAFDTSSLNLNGASLPDNNLFELLWVADTQIRDSLKGRSVSRKELYQFSSSKGRGGMRDVAVYGKERIAGVGDNSSPVVCDLASGKCRSINLEDKTKRYRAVEFIDKDRLVLVDVQGNLSRVDISKSDKISITPLGETSSKPATINGMAINGDEVLTVKDGKLYAVSLSKSSALREIPATGKIEGIFSVEKGQAIVAATNGLHLYNPASKGLVAINMTNFSTGVTAVAQAGSLLFTGNARGQVMAYELVGGKITELKPQWKAPLNAHKTQVTAIRYDPGENRLYTAGLDRNAIIYSLDLPPGKDIRNYAIRLVGFRKWIWDFETVPGPNGTIVYSADEDGSLLSWVTQPSEMHRRLGDFLRTSTPKRP